MRKYTTLPLRLLKRGPNARSDLGPRDEAVALARSRIKNQIHDLLVGPPDADGRHPIIDGNRTLYGAEEAGLLDSELRVIITDEVDTDEKRVILQIGSAVHRKGIDLIDRIGAVALLAPKMTNKQIAEELQVGQPLITQLRSFENLIDAGKEAVRDGRLSDIQKMYSVAQLPPEQQPAALAVALTGSRANVAKHSQQARNGSTKDEEDDTERLATVKIALPGDVTVSVRRKAEKGEELSLAMVVQYLLDAHKEANKGKEQGLTAKSFVNVMRDKAKAKPKAVNGEAVNRP